MIIEREVQESEIGVNSEEQIAQESKSYPIKARELAVIKSDEDQERAGQFLVTIKGFRKDALAFFKPLKDKVRAALNEILDKEKQVDAPLEEAERIIKGGMAQYQAEQEAIQRQEAERRQAEAKKQAENAQIALAAEIAQNGDHARADAVLKQPVAIAPVQPIKTAAPAGVSFVSVWKYEVFDLAALVKAVAAGQVPLSAIQINAVALNSQVKALKGEMKYPGIRVWQEKTVAARSR